MHHPRSLLACSVLLFVLSALVIPLPICHGSLTSLSHLYLYLIVEPIVQETFFWNEMHAEGHKSHRSTQN